MPAMSPKYPLTLQWRHERLIHVGAYRALKFDSPRTSDPKRLAPTSKLWVSSTLGYLPFHLSLKPSSSCLSMNCKNVACVVSDSRSSGNPGNGWLVDTTKRHTSRSALTFTRIKLGWLIHTVTVKDSPSAQIRGKSGECLTYDNS